MFAASIFQSVSYGWAGVIPRNIVEQVPAALGNTLVLVVQDRPAKPAYNKIKVRALRRLKEMAVK